MNNILQLLYDRFYAPLPMTEDCQEIEQYHRMLIERLDKPERKMVLRIIDAQDSIREQTSLDSFIAGFELAWRLSAEVHNDENERSVSCRTRRAGARFVSDEGSE